MFWLWNTIAVFCLSVFLAGVMIPEILLISFRRNLFDEPDARKIHTSAVPRLGGMAFIPVIFFVIALLLGLQLSVGEDALYSQLIAHSRTVAFAFCALFMLYIIGLADDLVGIRYIAKFAFQIICGVMLVTGCLTIDNWHGFLGLEQVPIAVGWAVTILLTVFIVNALNLIDGIDGLASGLSSVAMVLYGAIFFIAGNYLFALLAAATLGVLIPFFIFNVFGDPAKKQKIFMGDTGSLTIGLILCILSFEMLNMKPSAELKSINMLVAAMSPLIIPCFDVIRVYMYRIRHGRNPFLPDKKHIHHRLLGMGIKHRYAMLTILVASIVFTGCNIILSKWLNANIIILIDVAIWSLAMVFIPSAMADSPAQATTATNEITHADNDNGTHD